MNLSMKSILAVAALGLAYFSAGTVQAQTVASCPTTNVHASGTQLQDIIAYKNSPHTMMVGYWRTWGDESDNAYSGNNSTTTMNDLPDCVDIAVVFTDYTPSASPFWTQLADSYVPTLHSRGTKVIYTIGQTLLVNSAYPNTTAGYQALAQYLVDTYVTPYGLDGLDIDYESSLAGNSTGLQQAVGVIQALSQILDNKSAGGGILDVDTNLDGTDPLFQQVGSSLSYLFEQTYGRNASTMQTTASSYTADGIQVTQFGDSADLEGDGFDDFSSPLSSSNAYQLAAWQPSGAQKAAFFIYGIDIDGPNFPDTIQLIPVLNGSSSNSSRGGGGTCTLGICQ